MDKVVEKLGNMDSNFDSFFTLKKSLAQPWNYLGAFLVVSTQAFSSGWSSESQEHRLKKWPGSFYEGLKSSDQAWKGGFLRLGGRSIAWSLKGLHGRYPLSQASFILSPSVDGEGARSALGGKIAFHTKGFSVSAVCPFIDFDRNFKGDLVSYLSPRGQTLELSASLKRCLAWISREPLPLSRAPFTSSFFSFASQFKGHFSRSRGRWGLHQPLSNGWWLSFSQDLFFFEVKQWKISLSRLNVNNPRSLLSQLSLRCSESDSDSGSEAGEGSSSESGEGGDYYYPTSTRETWFQTTGRDTPPAYSARASEWSKECLRRELNKITTEHDLRDLFNRLRMQEPPHQGQTQAPYKGKGKKHGRKHKKALKHFSLPSEYIKDFSSFKEQAEALGWLPEYPRVPRDPRGPGTTNWLESASRLKKWIKKTGKDVPGFIGYLRRNYEVNNLILHDWARNLPPDLILGALSKLCSHDLAVFKKVFFRKEAGSETILHILSGNSMEATDTQLSKKLFMKKLARLFKAVAFKKEELDCAELVELLLSEDHEGNYYLHKLAHNRRVSAPGFLRHIESGIRSLFTQGRVRSIEFEGLISGSANKQGRTFLHLFCSKNCNLTTGALNELVFSLLNKISLLQGRNRTRSDSIHALSVQRRRSQSLLFSQDDGKNTYLHYLASGQKYQVLLEHLAKLRDYCPEDNFLEILDLQNNEGETIRGVIQRLGEDPHYARKIAVLALSPPSSPSGSSSAAFTTTDAVTSPSSVERTEISFAPPEVEARNWQEVEDESESQLSLGRPSGEETEEEREKDLSSSETPNREETEEEREKIPLSLEVLNREETQEGEEILPSLEVPSLEEVENTRLVSRANETEAGLMPYRILERLFEGELALETSLLFSLFSAKALFFEFEGKNLLAQLIQGTVPEKRIEASISMWFQELLSRNELGIEKCLVLLECSGGRGENIIHQLLRQGNSTSLTIFESILGLKEGGVLAALLSQQNEAGATPLWLALSEGRTLQARKIRKTIQGLMTEGALSESKRLELLKNQRDDQGGNILHLSLRSKKELFGSVRSKEEFSEFVAALLGMLKVDSYLELILEEDSNHRKPLQLSLDRNEFTFFNSLYNLETTQNVFLKLLETHADPEIGGNFLHALVIKLGEIQGSKQRELEDIFYKVLDYFGRLPDTDLPYQILSETTKEGEEILSLALSRWGAKSHLHPLIHRVIDVAIENRYFPEDPLIGAKLFEKSFDMKKSAQLNSTSAKLLNACISALGPDKFFRTIKAGSELWTSLFAGEQGVALLKGVTEILWGHLVTVVDQVFPYRLFTGQICKPVADYLSAVEEMLMEFNVEDPSLGEWLQKLEEGRKKFQSLFDPNRSHSFEGLKGSSSKIELKANLNEIFSKGTRVFRTFDKLAATFFEVGPVGAPARLGGSKEREALKENFKRYKTEFIQLARSLSVESKRPF